MSSTQPPSEPPTWRPAPPPPFQPSGRPPAPPAPPEVLDQGSGAPLAPGGRGRGTKRGLLIGGGVLGLLVVGGGAWAAMSFLGTGAQPAEALPATTLGYASIDLDPSGGQKIEALRTLDKFPALDDISGLDSGDDLRRTIFDLIQGEAGCESLDFEDDIDPWLGNRAAIAAVPDADGDPQPVVVVQVAGEEAFEKGIKAIEACDGGGAGEGGDGTGYVVAGEWATIAPTQDIADAVAAATEKGTLADDETYQKWTGETGDAGVATLYAAPSAGPAILDGLGSGLGGGLGGAGLPEQLVDQLADFQGIAATIRFADGTLELEAAAQTPDNADEVLGTSTVADRVGALPDDTGAVLGLSLGQGWFAQAVDSLASGMGGGSSDDMISELEQATGLSLPDDIDTLTQDGVVLSVAPGIDPEAIANATDPSDVPVALSLHGDADELEGIVGKLQGAVPGGDELLGTTADGDTLVVGPDADYRDQVAGGGGLGDSERFQQVVRDPDSAAVLYLDVDAFDDVIGSLGGQQVADNIEPLSAIGMSSTRDGDVTKLVLRVGTDD